MALYQYEYGIESPDVLDQVQVELEAYRLDLTIEQGGLGGAAHFKNIADILYGPDSEEPFIWHPWAEKMNECAHAHPVTGATRPHIAFSGCASSGKSMYGALFGIINWLADPQNTYVFITSTSLSEAKHRVWKSVIKLFNAVPQLPGKLIDSLGKIPTIRPDGNHDDTAGIFLIAAAPSKEAQAVGKLIGRKNKRVVFIADELAELSPAILAACFGNLMANPFFQFMAMSNFKSRYDPFGEFVSPKDGYDSISIDTEEWETEKGYCVRFDGTKSPNIMMGRDEFPWIYGSKQLATHKKDFGENSAMFWRMCRSFEAPISIDNSIYTEADLLAGLAYKQTVWMSPPTPISAMDPSFSNGGDRCVQIMGSYGLSIDSVWTIQVDEIRVLHEDAMKRVPRDYQIARQFRDNCIAMGVAPQHAGTDVTGAGAPLYSIISEEWNSLVLPVNFSGAPSETYVRANDTLMAKSQFDRRVSELWWVGKEFMKYGQIRGITKDLARELKARHYETAKGPDGLKVCVESKKDMRERLGFSPDQGDAWAVLVEVCRQRLGALAGGSGLGLVGSKQAFDTELELVNQIYSNVSYEEPQYQEALI
jgi:hypothetical protein